MNNFFLFKKKSMAPVYLLPFSGVLSRREATLCFSLSRYKSHKGRQIPPLHPIYIHTHTHTLFRSFFLLMVRSFSRVRPAIFVDNQKTRSQQTNLTHNVHTHTHREPFFFLFLSLPPCSTVWKKREKSPDNQIYIKWRTLCVGTNRLTSSFFTLNGSLLSNFFLFFFLFLSINRMFIQAAKPLRVCVLNNGRW
jgi:hypothetical protein